MLRRAHLLPAVMYLLATGIAPSIALSCAEVQLTFVVAWSSTTAAKAKKGIARKATKVEERRIQHIQKYIYSLGGSW